VLPKVLPKVLVYVGFSVAGGTNASVGLGVGWGVGGGVGGKHAGLQTSGQAEKFAITRHKPAGSSATASQSYVGSLSQSSRHSFSQTAGQFSTASPTQLAEGFSSTDSQS